MRRAGLVICCVLASTSACSKPEPGTPTSSDVDPIEARAEPGTPTPVQMAGAAHEALAKAFRVVGLEASPADGGVTVGGKAITVAVTIDGEHERGPQHIAAAAFRVTIDGQPRPEYDAGAIGIGSSRTDARQTAVAEWFTEYGAPIAFAIAADLGAAGPPSTKDGAAAFHASKVVGPQRLYHGPPGLRGDAADVAAVTSDAFVAELAELVAGQGPPPFRTATIAVVVEGEQATGGECRIDGRVDIELLEDLKQMPWPAGAPSYMYKQFFVVSPATPGEKRP